MEAGVKYLILGALSTGFLVYGIAWIYGTLGSTHLETISAAVLKCEFDPTYLHIGIALILIAFGFEVGHIAGNIAAGHGFTVSPEAGVDLRTGWVSPLYPLLLAGIFKLVGA